MAGKDEIEIALVPKSQMEEIQKKLDTLNEALQDIRQNWQPKEPPVYLSRNEVAAMLGITLATLHSWDKKGLLKRYSIQNRVWYKRDEVEAALK
ncbi:helix-turn-helix domain-containing protein [Zunongwangia sp. F260]|uniref:Helix-turn-helix domain-containing protein n=1 Tax=Autumnicola lenta TaxID=3075593 RepID=A0ABU3CML0_9FLAO|nr:helix-turn-helix domain-containing protein [Zunongwangia sp. F260]MDT0647472.1 helix-turn-helix domain-containing protein [Zunongwangia sp. F260]